MSKNTHETSNDMGSLAEDARALMAATADVAGEKVGGSPQTSRLCLGERPGQSGPRRQSGR